MQKIPSSRKRRWKYYLALGLLAAAPILTFLIVNRADVEISDVSWEPTKGSYLVTFLVQNKTQAALSANLTIRLYRRQFVAGSPKAEVLDLVAQKNLHISLSSSESREIKELVKPKKLAGTIQMVTVDTSGVQTK
jgi:hypothetical protein